MQRHIILVAVVVMVVGAILYLEQAKVDPEDFQSIISEEVREKLTAELTPEDKDRISFDCC